MYNEYRVVVFAINMTGGNSEVTHRLADEQSAIIKFHDMCSSYGGNTTAVRKATVMLFDTDGGLVRKEDFVHELVVEE